MKRILLAAVASLSLLVALPAISTASSDRSRDHGDRVGHDRGRDHDRGDRRREDRRQERRRHDERQVARHKHFGVNDNRPAGTVQSFQNGVLTIALTNGSTVSGQVTPRTRVDCEAMDNENHARRDGGSGSGDRGDRGDRGDQGDDNGNDNDNDRGDRRDDNDPSCVALLHHAGTKVLDAELNVFHGSAFWEEVELGL